MRLQCRHVLHASRSSATAGTLRSMAPRIQAAVVESLDPPGWIVRVVGSDESRSFALRKEAEAYAQSLAWTREGRERARRQLRTEPA
jgi:hypothetical protein